MSLMISSAGVTILGCVSIINIILILTDHSTYTWSDIPMFVKMFCLCAFLFIFEYKLVESKMIEDAIDRRKHFRVNNQIKKNKKKSKRTKK